MDPLAVLHIPHSADVIPADLRDTFRLSDQELTHELLVMTDRHTDELFTVCSVAAKPVRFPISRLVVDPERYLDDSLEPMAARGMGVLYTQTSDGRTLRTPPTSFEREVLIERFYRPHHIALSVAVERALKENNACLLLDCHSFPSKPLPCDLDHTMERPDICIGTDRSNTPVWLVTKAMEFLTASGLAVEIDRPYSGVLVPESYAGHDSRVHALMIEINRRLYMDEKTACKLGAFNDLAAFIEDFVLSLINETVRRIPVKKKT